MTTELHGVQSIALGQFCTDCGTDLGVASGQPTRCQKCEAVAHEYELTNYSVRLVTATQELARVKAERDELRALVEGFVNGDPSRARLNQARALLARLA